MQTIPIAQAKRDFPDRHLRFRVFSFDAGHDQTTRSLAKNIYHRQTRTKTLSTLSPLAISIAATSATEIFRDFDH